MLRAYTMPDRFSVFALILCLFVSFNIGNGQSTDFTPSVDQNSSTTLPPTNETTVSTTMPASPTSAVTEILTTLSSMTTVTEIITTPDFSNNTSPPDVQNSTSSTPRRKRNHLSHPYQVHSCLQMLAWCVMAAIGFFVEIHYPVVFTTRRGLQIKLASLFQLVSMILALSGIVSLAVIIGWTTMNLHKILGVCAMLMRLIGAIMMLIRPRGNAPPRTIHSVAKVARIILTRGSFLVAIVAIYTGLKHLYLELEVPLWSVALLAALVIIDIIFEAILFIHAHRMQNSRDEHKRLLTFSRDSDLDRGADIDSTTPVKLTSGRFRTAMLVIFMALATIISVAVIAGAIYAKPPPQTV